MMEIDHLCEKLQAIQIRFQLHHKNITALRDGLFSASAVMESRASTRLGGQLDPPTSQEATDEHRKCQTLDLRQHLLSATRILHLALEHERRIVSSQRPDIRYHSCCICNIHGRVQSRHSRQTFHQYLRISSKLACGQDEIRSGQVLEIKRGRIWELLFPSEI